MKVLLISPFTSASGSAIRFWNIAIELHKKGYKVIYVDRKAPGISQLYCSKDIEYHSCKSTGMLFIDIVISLLFNFYVLLKNLDCQIFYALKPAPNNCIPALLAKFLKKKIFLDVDDLDYAYFIGWKSRLFKLMFNFFANRFPVVTFHTPNLQKYLQEEVSVPQNRLYYLAQGVSDNFLQFNYDDSQTICKSVVYVATLGITSDFGDLIDGLVSLCRKYPGMLIDIVGEGCRKKDFKIRVDSLGAADQIRFTGKIDHDKLPGFIAMHQIGINYMRPLEVNYCRAILKIREYLAAGLHVVCNNVGDVELFKDHIYIEPDIDGMVSKLDKLLSLPVKKNIEGQKYICQQYDWEKIVSEFILEKISSLQVF